jgi:hypothetical protein
MCPGILSQLAARRVTSCVRECSGKVGLVVRFRRPWRQQILLFKGAEQIAFDGTHLTPARSSVAHAISMHYIIYITQHL